MSPDHLECIAHNSRGHGPVKIDATHHNLRTSAPYSMKLKFTVHWLMIMCSCLPWYFFIWCLTDKHPTVKAENRYISCCKLRDY